MNSFIPKKGFLCSLLILIQLPAYCWGFYGHRQINYYAVFLLPPELVAFYKPHIAFLRDHAVDPDKRRYLLAEEGPRHFIDLDHYASQHPDSLPMHFEEAVRKYGEDSIKAHGIVPWWIPVMLQRLTHAFKEKNIAGILKLSADIGHYIGDAHVPLHATSNYNGQQTSQRGIHGFWESRIPELLEEKEWSFFMEKASYISNPTAFIWKRVRESAAAADTVLRLERDLSASFPDDKKYAFEERNGKTIRQYSSAFATAYDKKLKGMIERRMRQSVYAVASFWYTAWINAGQPDLRNSTAEGFTETDRQELDQLNQAWLKGPILGRPEE
ncbi:MAG TPA: zinc dependent phospholipase C family protein [Flavisolibacter sp.]|jgi:hypothetical protein|nr:zinc dependent phospholipase C family protein [Flavisolibacter sp.]